MKKLLAILLAGILAASIMTGCGQTKLVENAPETDAVTQSEEGEDLAAAAIAERKESGKATKVVMALMCITDVPKGLERVNEKISEYTKEKLGIEVELLVMDPATYDQQMNLMLSSGEQVDVFNATSKRMSYVSMGYCLDMEENDLINIYGSEIFNVPNAPFIDSLRVNGKLYGLPVHKENAVGQLGFVVAKEYLDEIGYDYDSMERKWNDDRIYIDEEKLTDMFSQLHEAFPEKTVVSVSSFEGSFFHDGFDDSFGVILNNEEPLKIENMFTSEEFYEACKMYYKWNQAGFFSADALTESANTATEVRAGTLMAYAMGGKYGIATQESGNCGQEMLYFQLSDDISYTNAPQAFPWCINSRTEDPIAAMQLLNALYTDPYLANLLLYGEEGVDYKVTEDGFATWADGVDPANPEYHINVGWEIPNQFLTYVWEGYPSDLWEKTIEFNNNAIKSKTQGFNFDNSAVLTEFAALSNVYNQYIPQLYKGFLDPEIGISEMEKKLEAAGLQKYMDAKQAALDEWIATKDAE